ncbi:phospholipase C [Gluconobacter wancherniae]|uniref:Phospholipase C n=1 Tax=Gluconobacter wancherniae NBRC 103581 TaxID=656744 RepID=A0A511AXJ4_9PROT|nr:alkaline phosphatase family protein [Gluconobacter wancherniae]MBF0853108.1 alkaline phosphatase family protein [Gluconobacter wancherniae]GBD56174.1 phospholipase C [Gluconobacter wancherniae NBRC 103581]GBR63337.1 acid phosphatase [Gluconobacter wancherniae NBRC 103581]GEK92925.1 phospholipase C [Gluconobacter wancherniae NBRC 103581]
MTSFSQRLLLASSLLTVSVTALPACATPTKTATPVRHLVVLYNENVSFDHYFGTYPKAANPVGEPAFNAKPDTPAANTLASAGMLTSNPNTNPQNGLNAALPFRLDRTQAATADQNHAYTAEQLAYHHGKADLFPRYTGRGSPGGVGSFSTHGQVMGYFDGNTVTALWNYAQHFALSDAFYTDAYGPSTPGALEVVSGQTNGMRIKTTTQPPATRKIASPYVGDGQGGWTMINDIDPADDVCSTPKNQVWMTGKNIGDLLTQAEVTWGGFMGGFNLQATNSNGTTACQRSIYSQVVAQNIPDYIPHHNWFQYYQSTANPTHARPSSIEAIGQTNTADGKGKDPANHEYDLEDFYAVTQAGHMPAVSFLKLPAAQDAHAGYSDPLDEQEGIVRLLNFIQSRPEWKDTAVIIAYDDSDGWYDHAFIRPLHSSMDPEVDQLDGPGRCGNGVQPEGVSGRPVNGRCGPGTRLPLVLISPWAKTNHVGHTQITQSSITRFIEDNWLGGKRLGGGSFDAGAHDLNDLFDFNQPPRLTPLLLDPKTGTPISTLPAVASH